MSKIDLEAKYHASQAINEAHDIIGRMKQDNYKNRTKEPNYK